MHDPPPELSTDPDPEHARVAEQAELAEIGRYVLLRELGRGAIGVVYAAYHEGLDRKLAIKVLNRQRAGQVAHEARLRREARALAKLSHPNVVQVYDVGESEGRVFVVMEYVEGQTLGAWMKQARAVDEILAMFIEAGRGLAAAHAAGVIHRDFKPDNVIVGDDGRPRVLDFGLARPLELDGRERDAGPAAEAPRELEAATEAVVGEATRDRPGQVELERSRELETRLDEDPSLADSERADTLPSHSGETGLEVLTRVGARVGTPAYMSPEQHAAASVGPAADQFSFCVALYEGLYGHRPYTARRLEQLRVQVESGAIVDAPPNSTVPAWLREVVLRGLAPRAEARWPSMDALLDALEPEPDAPRRWPQLLAVAILGALAAALAFARAQPAQAPSCPSVVDQRAQVWTPAQAQALAEAFAATGLAYAPAAWAAVELRLSAWADGWAAQRVEACEAGRSSGEGVDRVALDRRQACLARERRAFDALLAHFAAADRAIVEGAVEAAAALAEPSRCAEPEADGGLAPAPALVADEVATLRDHLAELETHRSTGRWESGASLARATVARARATGYEPLVAEALLTQGRLLTQSASRADEALSTLQDALDAADRSAHLELAPQIATELVLVSIYAKPDPARGRLWSRRALAGLDRLERRGAATDGARGRELGYARARSSWALGNLERLDGDNERAETSLRAALEQLEQHAPDHPDRGPMLNDLANALGARGERDEAQAVYMQALREGVASFGEGHPRVANTHYNLARLAREQGDLARARAEAEQAFVIYSAARGPRSRDVGAVELLRASIELEGGDAEAARRHALEARAIYDRELASDNVDRAEPHQMLGNVAFALATLDLAQLDVAAEHYREALEIKRAALPEGHIELCPTLTNLGLVYLNLGRLDDAIAALGPAAELLGASEAVDPQRLRAARLYLADALISRAGPGDTARARALALAGLADCGDAPLCAELRATLELTRGQDE